MRRCAACQVIKSLDDFYASQASYCKPCWCAYESARRKAKLAAESLGEREERLAARRLKRTGHAGYTHIPRPVVDGERVCGVCRRSKPLEEFHRNRSTGVGVATICKVCALARHQAYYEENRSERLAYERTKACGRPCRCSRLRARGLSSPCTEGPGVEQGSHEEDGSTRRAKPCLRPRPPPRPVLLLRWACQPSRPYRTGGSGRRERLGESHRRLPALQPREVRQVPAHLPRH